MQYLARARNGIWSCTHRTIQSSAVVVVDSIFSLSSHLRIQHNQSIAIIDVIIMQTIIFALFAFGIRLNCCCCSCTHAHVQVPIFHRKSFEVQMENLKQQTHSCEFFASNNNQPSNCRENMKLQWVFSTLLFSLDGTTATDNRRKDVCLCMVRTKKVAKKTNPNGKAKLYDVAFVHIFTLRFCSHYNPSHHILRCIDANDIVAEEMKNKSGK